MVVLPLEEGPEMPTIKASVGLVGVGAAIVALFTTFAVVGD